MDPKALTFLMAMFPIAEVRGALPLSLVFFKLKDSEALFWSISGNILIVPVIFLFLKFLQSAVFQKVSFLKSFSDFFFTKLQKKYGSRSFKNLFGLTLFVGIPLPFTGAWTGSIISFLLGIPFRFAFFAISLGVILSSILVFFTAKAGVLLEKNFGPTAIFIFLLLLSLLLLLPKNEN